MSSGADAYDENLNRLMRDLAASIEKAMRPYDNLRPAFNDISASLDALIRDRLDTSQLTAWATRVQVPDLLPRIDVQRLANNLLDAQQNARRQALEQYAADLDAQPEQIQPLAEAVAEELAETGIEVPADDPTARPRKLTQAEWYDAAVWATTFFTTDDFAEQKLTSLGMAEAEAAIYGTGAALLIATLVLLVWMYVTEHDDGVS